MARDFKEEGVPLIRLAGLKRGADILQGCNYLEPAKVKTRWSQFQVHQDDVLLSTSASLGEVAVVPAQGVGAVPYTGIIASALLMTGSTRPSFRTSLLPRTSRPR